MPTHRSNNPMLHIHVWLAGAAIVAPGLAVLHSCVDQPKPHCTTFPASAGAYAMRLIEEDREESADGVCDEVGNDSYNSNP